MMAVRFHSISSNLVDKYMRIRSLIILFVLVILQAGCTLQPPPETWQQTLTRTVNAYAPTAEARLVPYFHRAGVYYPPQQVALLVFKQEKKLELWASDGQRWTWIKTYSILAASGGPGPKLHEGDDQVPEGIYRIVSLNPRSRFHVSMALNYPNDFDREHARFDHRYDLGENIYIHGNSVSVGCIAIGDIAIEELFVLVYKTGLEHVEVIIAPNDLRHAPPPRENNKPVWVPMLYHHLSSALMDFENKNQYA